MGVRSGNLISTKTVYMCHKYDADGARMKPRSWSTDEGYWCEQHQDESKWRPSIHMPRWVSRITLEIMGVRVERLQDISDSDCYAEGIDECDGLLDVAEICHLAKAMNLPAETRKPTFAALWEALYGPGSWDVNLRIWVIEFKRVEAE